MIRIVALILAAVLALPAIADEARLSAYGVARTFDFRILAADGTYVTNATDGGTDVTLTCDDGTPATATNDFADEGSHYSIALTAAELQCARLVVDVADAIANGFVVETYGHANAGNPTLGWLTGDAFARLGAPAGASHAADIVVLDNFVDDLESRLGTPSNFGSGTSTIAANLQDLADDGTATFDRATDSLQAIRDRGDAAWDTATGFSTHSAADVWTSGTRTLTAGTNIVLAKGTGVTGFNDLSAAQVNTEVASVIGRRTTITVTDQDTFTLAAGATFDNAYLGWGVKINDAGSQDEWLGKVESYVGSSKTVELNRVAGFTIATGDTVTLYPAFLYEAVDTALVNCTVNTANFAGSTTTLACILTDKDGAAVTVASGDLTGLELVITSGAQAYERRYLFMTTWDGTNSELQITLDRALPATVADAVTAIIR